MFDDAEEYFWHDPTGPQKTDQFVQGRVPATQYIIVLTDGQPNLDLGVTQSPGLTRELRRDRRRDPYGQVPLPGGAWTTAQALYGNGTTNRSRLRAGPGHSVTITLRDRLRGQPGTSTGTRSRTCSNLAKTGSALRDLLPATAQADGRLFTLAVSSSRSRPPGRAARPELRPTSPTRRAISTRRSAWCWGRSRKQLTSKTLPVYSAVA